MTDSKVVVSEEALRSRVYDLGEEISRDYAGTELDVVCFINGASTFCADLVRHIRVPTRQHFLSFASYPQGNASGEVRVTLDVAEPLFRRHVLVVEGIVVSGRTIKYALDMLALRRPESLVMCALGVKRAQLAVDLPLKYVGFEMGPEIVMGYGVGSGVERALPHLVAR